MGKSVHQEMATVLQLEIVNIVMAVEENGIEIASMIETEIEGGDPGLSKIKKKTNIGFENYVFH